MTWQEFVRLVAKGTAVDLQLHRQERLVTAYLPKKPQPSGQVYGGCTVTMLDVSDERFQELEGLIK
jgi:hypothetical protein